MEIRSELRLHADDLKQLEDMFARAWSRALLTVVRMTVKEGLFDRFMRPEPVATPVQTAPPIQPVQPVPSEVPPEIRPIVPVQTPPPPLADIEKFKPKKKEPRRSILQVCKTVGTRPPGYITIHDAAKLIAGLTPDAAYHQITKWALDQEVKALIVADNKWTPTKGLPGRLMVENDSVKSREKIRQQNIKMPGRLRQSAPKQLVTV